MSSLRSFLIDRQVLSVYILASGTAFVPEVADFATTEACFALTPGMVGSATMLAIFFIATLRSGNFVSFVVFGIV